MAPRTRPSTFPPFVTASKWSTAWTAVFQAALKSNGKGHAPDGTMVPRLTNAEAVTLVMGWMEAATLRRFPLWYQFGAVAYGWDPSTDKLDTSTARAAKLYPLEATHELWLATSDLSDVLDVDAPTAPRLALDGTFGDAVFQGQVRAALREDGAEAAFKIPLPACKDPKTGKPTGKPHKDKDGKWTCDPVVIDDPLTAAKKSVFWFALMVGAGLWYLSNKPRRYRRRIEG